VIEERQGGEAEGDERWIPSRPSRGGDRGVARAKHIRDDPVDHDGGDPRGDGAW